MSETDSNAADVIDSYRKRKDRIGPLVMGGLAIVLLVVGALFVILWLTGDSSPAIPAIFASDTPVPTETATPLPPSLTPTITDTSEPTLSPTPEGPLTYIVSEGDTLFSIADQFQVDVFLLMTFNNITNPDSLFVGEELTIPTADSELPTKTPLPESLFPGQEIEYRIEPGDTLQLIAAKFNSVAETIAERNEIEDPNSIGVGQIIIVIVNIATPTPTVPPA
jgi:LysM repeat protein